MCRSTVLTKSTELAFLTGRQFYAVIKVNEIELYSYCHAHYCLFQEMIDVPYLYVREPPVVVSEISKKIIMQTCGVKYSSFIAIYLLTGTVTVLCL